MNKQTNNCGLWCTYKQANKQTIVDYGVHINKQTNNCGLWCTYKQANKQTTVDYGVHINKQLWTMVYI